MARSPSYCPMCGAGLEDDLRCAKCQVVYYPDSVADRPPPEDPWAHRATSMRCGTCMWYVMKTPVGEQELGRCRRHAPTMSGYPVVFPADWCGDHKLDGASL